MNENIIERARRYLAKMSPAISGSGGHPATYRAALAMVKGFSLPLENTLPLLLEWNAACLPPWTEAELRHKLADAAKSATPAGYLLGEHHASVDEGARKAAYRLHWPTFRKPTAEDLATIAGLRGVSENAAYLITRHRNLWCCRDYDGRECFVIRSGTFAQWRRIDGELFTWTDKKDGKEKSAKAKNLPGSEGAFLNPGGMGDATVPVIITEGAISILEATEAILRADGSTHPLHSVAVLAAASASSRFTTSHLAKLSGRRVRIIPDADEAGQDAAVIWTANLRDAGCKVDNVRLPPGCKDLGDALRAIPAGDRFWQQLVAF